MQLQLARPYGRAWGKQLSAPTGFDLTMGGFLTISVVEERHVHLFGYHFITVHFAITVGGCERPRQVRHLMALLLLTRVAKQFQLPEASENSWHLAASSSSERSIAGMQFFDQH